MPKSFKFRINSLEIRKYSFITIDSGTVPC